MCLTIKRKSGKLTAKKDIVCYKFLEFRLENSTFKKHKGVLITPFQYEYISIGETYVSDLHKEPDYTDSFSTVQIGLHSIKSEKDCTDLAKFWVDCDRNQMICKCIIPKGSKYYVGNYGEIPSYASSAIQYVEIIKTLSV